MPDGYAGRSLVFNWNDAVVPGVREKGVNLNGEPIDTTSDENNGWRTLLTDAVAQNQVDLTISGVTKSKILRQAWFSSERSAEVTLEYPDGDVISARFVLVSYNEGAPYNDAMTFDATLQSTGVVAYTPGGA